jgi:hypothetical protein
VVRDLSAFPKCWVLQKQTKGMIPDVLLKAIEREALRAPLGSREEVPHAENLRVIHRRTLILGLESGKLPVVVQGVLRKLV